MVSNGRLWFGSANQKVGAGCFSWQFSSSAQDREAQERSRTWLVELGSRSSTMPSAVQCWGSSMQLYGTHPSVWVALCFLRLITCSPEKLCMGNGSPYGKTWDGPNSFPKEKSLQLLSMQWHQREWEDSWTFFKVIGCSFLPARYWIFCDWFSDQKAQSLQNYCCYFYGLKKIIVIGLYMVIAYGCCAAGSTWVSVTYSLQKLSILNRLGTVFSRLLEKSPQGENLFYFTSLTCVKVASKNGEVRRT